MTTPEWDDDSIDTLLREARRDIPDGGFSDRVVAALPQRSVIWEACSKRVVILLVAFVASCLLFRWIGMPQDLPLRPFAAEVSWGKLVKADTSSVNWKFRSLEPGKLLMEELVAVSLALAGMGAALYSLIEEY